MDQRIWGEVAGDCEQLFINISSRLSSFDPISLPSPPPTSEKFLEILIREYGDGGKCEKIISLGRWEGEESADSNAYYEASATKFPWELNEKDKVDSKAKWEGKELEPRSDFILTLMPYHWLMAVFLLQICHQGRNWHSIHLSCVSTVSLCCMWLLNIPFPTNANHNRFKREEQYIEWPISSL